VGKKSFACLKTGYLFVCKAVLQYRLCEGEHVSVMGTMVLRLTSTVAYQHVFY